MLRPHADDEAYEGLAYHLKSYRRTDAIMRDDLMRDHHAAAAAENEWHARSVPIYDAAIALGEERPFAVDIDLAAALVGYYDAASAALAQGRRELANLYLRDARVCAYLMRLMGLDSSPVDPASPIAAAVRRWKAANGYVDAPEFGAAPGTTRPA